MFAGLAGEKTTTQVITETKRITRTETKVRMKTRTVEADPATVTETQTETEVVTEPPTYEGVSVDLGQYEGLVAIHGAQWQAPRFEGDGDHVIGLFENLGAECAALSYAQIDGTLFQEGTIIGTAFTNLTNVAAGSRFPFDLGFERTVTTKGGIELVVTQADC